MIYSPGVYQHYHGDGVGLANDWLHFSGPCARELVHAYALPQNMPFRPLSTAFVAPILAEMSREMRLMTPFWQEALELLLGQLCLQLRRQMNARTDVAASLHKTELLQRFQALRIEIADTLDHPWTVSKMADRVHLSRSRFSALYREFFGTTVVEDLIIYRLHKAEWLLTNTLEAIGVVGVKCGFSNPYYFSRLFHKRVGCPPREYYRRHVAASRVARQLTARGG